MFRTPPVNDWFIYEDSQGAQLAIRLSQVQWVSFPESRKTDKHPCTIDMINGKSWNTDTHTGQRLIEAIKLKALS